MAADGGQIDNLSCSLLFHDWQCGCDPMQHTADIHVNHAVPFVYLKFFKSRKRHHSGVIHDYVDSAISFQTELGKSLYILKRCDVQSPVFSSSAITSNRLCKCL